MPRQRNFPWAAVLPVLKEMKAQGKTLFDLVLFVKENYGREFTRARISQVLVKEKRADANQN